MGCCTSIKHELFHASMYDLSDPTYHAEAVAPNKIIDIQETFAPRPHLLFVAAKLVLAIWLVATIVISILESDPYFGFWFAYLSSWGMLFTATYMLCSFFSAALLSYHHQPQERNTGEMKGKIGILLKITWSLFAVAFPAEIVITLLFWFLVFDGRLKYTTFMLHGVAWVIIGIDGILINRIPLRMKQFIIFEVFAVCYLVWTILHSTLNVDNPWKNAAEGESEPIYNTLDWKNDTGFAVGLAFGLLLVGNPIAFLFCRALSRSLPMRCCNIEASEAFNDEESLEMPTRES